MLSALDKTIKGTQDHIILAFLYLKTLKSSFLKLILKIFPKGAFPPCGPRPHLGARPFSKDMTPLFKKLDPPLDYMYTMKGGEGI